MAHRCINRRLSYIHSSWLWSLSSRCTYLARHINGLTCRVSSRSRSIAILNHIDWRLYGYCWERPILDVIKLAQVCIHWLLVVIELGHTLIMKERVGCINSVILEGWRLVMVSSAFLDPLCWIMLWCCWPSSAACWSWSFFCIRWRGRVIRRYFVVIPVPNVIEKPPDNITVAFNYFFLSP